MGAAFTKRFTETICDLLSKPVFKKCNANRIDELSFIVKKVCKRCT